MPLLMSWSTIFSPNLVSVIRIILFPAKCSCEGTEILTNPVRLIAVT